MAGDFEFQGKTLSGEAPSPYVKLYLLPDLLKETKRKTRVAKNTFHPTYNEMVIYLIFSHLRLLVTKVPFV